MENNEHLEGNEQAVAFLRRELLWTRIIAVILIVLLAAELIFMGNVTGSMNRVSDTAQQIDIAALSKTLTEIDFAGISAALEKADLAGAAEKLSALDIESLNKTISGLDVDAFNEAIRNLNESVSSMQSAADSFKAWTDRLSKIFS